MNLGPGAEFDRIRAIFGRLAELLPNNTPLGDDCALVPFGDATLAVSIDTSLEGVHFRTDWLDFRKSDFAPPVPRSPIWPRKARCRWVCSFRSVFHPIRGRAPIPPLKSWKAWPRWRGTSARRSWAAT